MKILYVILPQKIWKVILRVIVCDCIILYQISTNQFSSKSGNSS